MEASIEMGVKGNEKYIKKRNEEYLQENWGMKGE